MRVPRCETCKSRHNKAVDDVGWQWAGRQSWSLLLFLACVVFVYWVNAGASGIFLAIITAILILVPIAHIVDKTFPRDRILGAKLASTKPPAACILFPPLVERLHGDWNAYVSPYLLYGNWFRPYEVVRGFTLNRSLEHSQPQCLEHLFRFASDSHDLSPTTIAMISKNLGLYELHALAAARERTGAGASKATIRALLKCGHCARSFEIGKDSVAISAEFAMRGAIVFSGGHTPDREDLVSSLDDLSTEKRPAALERASPSWTLIQDSLTRGDRRTWRCKACNGVNRYRDG